MITKASECSVRKFMAAMYDGNLDGFAEGGLDTVFTQYVDLSGIGESREYTLMASIHNLELRVNYMTAQLELQMNSMAGLKMPFFPAIADFKKYGHRLKWDANNPEGFVKQLTSIDLRERKFIAELDTRNKELKDLRENGMKKDGNARHDFIIQLNRLGKEGYKIDKDDTDMETLALMIRDNNETLRARSREAAAQHKS